jgi:hypothetical protein
MAERTYTTKSRAKRIALDYFKRPHPLRRAKLVLSIALPLVAVVVVAVHAVRGDRRLYTSGPVSTAHALFGARCEDCHSAPPSTAAGAAPINAFFVPVSDLACSLCHDGPVHQNNQGFTPACSSCHFEHKGRVRLVDLTDRQCTQCHAGLATKDGRPPAFSPKIERFSSDHPEFAVTAAAGTAARVRLDAKPGPADDAQVCLDHQKHLKLGLFRADAPWYRPGMKGVVETPKGLRLGCTYCHRPEGDGAHMAPISYAKHCADCHPLAFDSERFPGATVPHDKPEIVHAFLRTKYTESPEGERTAKPVTKEAATEKPEEEAGRPRRRLGAREPVEEERPRRRLGGRGEPEAAPPPPTKAARGFKEVEALLFFKNKESADTCLLCHTLTVPERAKPSVSCAEINGKPASEAVALIGPVQAALKGARGEKLPAVAATRIPARWLPHSSFDHRAHRPLGCVECHKAPESTNTADVLIPSVATCRECHRDSGGARTACIACHRYHDKTKESDTDGLLTIRRLSRGGPRSGVGSR